MWGLFLIDEHVVVNKEEQLYVVYIMVASEYVLESCVLVASSIIGAL
jgi:hypothetical protein